MPACWAWSTNQSVGLACSADSGASADAALPPARSSRAAGGSLLPHAVSMSTASAAESSFCRGYARARGVWADLIMLSEQRLLTDVAVSPLLRRQAQFRVAGRAAWTGAGRWPPARERPLRHSNGNTGRVPQGRCRQSIPTELACQPRAPREVTWVYFAPAVFDAPVTLTLTIAVVQQQ